MKRIFAIGILLFSLGVAAQEVLPLYEGKIPNAIDAADEEAVRDPSEPYPFVLNVSRPTLTVYLPKQRGAATSAVLIFPGGSYRGASIVKEGHDVALAFNEMGVAAFVVKYRTPSPAHMADRTRGPLQDAQQAIGLVRLRAGKWNINPKRVGMVGFSAGGHLAATAGIYFEQPVAAGREKVNLRPDFLILLYPVISFTDPLAHPVSRNNLLGETPSPELTKHYSLESAVTKNVPPTFLMHAADDRTVKVENALRFFEALRAQDISAEMHIYPRGGHGFGLNNATTQDRWIDRCKNWLVSQGMLARP